VGARWPEEEEPGGEGAVAGGRGPAAGAWWPEEEPGEEGAGVGRRRRSGRRSPRGRAEVG
jgi:hypothetical protein